MSTSISRRLNRMVQDLSGIQPQRNSGRTTHSLITRAGVTSSKAAILAAEQGNRKGPTVSVAEVETMLRIDGFTHAQIEKYVMHMIRPGFYFKGQKGKSTILETWSKNIRLKKTLEQIVKTIFGLGLGIAWVEVGYTKEMDDIVKLQLIDPRSGMDFIRDKQTNMIKKDDYGDPIGYIQEKDFMGNTTTWTKDKITKGDQEIWVATSEEDDGRDFVSWFTLFTITDDYEPYSPIEGVYRDARARLNNTANIEETGFRGGGLVARVGDPNAPVSAVPEETIDGLAKDLQNVSHQDIFVFGRDVELGTFPIPDLKDRDSLLYFFTDLQCGGMQMPLTMMLEPKSAYKGEAESKGLEFENVIITLQERLAEQVEDKLLAKYMKCKGKDLAKVPEMVFRTFMPAIRLSKARRIGKLFSDGVLHWSKGIEQQIREEEGLPIDDIPDSLEPETKEEPMDEEEIQKKEEATQIEEVQKIQKQIKDLSDRLEEIYSET